MATKNKPGQGRKKGDPTDTINLRVKVSLKEDARLKFGKGLNGKVREYLEKITYNE